MSDDAALIARLRAPPCEFDLLCPTRHDALEAADRIAALTADNEFLHKRRGDLVIERDRYKAALGEHPEGRDVMLGGALAEIETQRARATKAEAERDTKEKENAELRAEILALRNQAQR